ncbi:unnamed protein product, partial [Closterium sp. NIES-54]
WRGRGWCSCGAGSQRWGRGTCGGRPFCWVHGACAHPRMPTTSWGSLTSSLTTPP